MIPDVEEICHCSLINHPLYAYSDRTLMGMGRDNWLTVCYVEYFTLQGERKWYPSRGKVQMGFEAIFAVLH